MTSEKQKTIKKIPYKFVHIYWIDITSDSSWRSIEDVKEEKGGIAENVIKIIKECDDGEGADYEEVLEKVKNEKLINSLMEEGEIFEIKPGKLKVL